MLDYFSLYSNYDKLHFLYAGGSHVSTLECLYDCLFDNMFLFCRNELILILTYLIPTTSTFIRTQLCLYIVKKG